MFQHRFAVGLVCLLAVPVLFADANTLVGRQASSSSSSPASTASAVSVGASALAKRLAQEAPAATSAEKDETLLCNGYAEFCSRAYSKITMVGIHNSPFVKKNNIAANQELTVEDQLNDGARFLQGQMHWPHSDPDGEAHFCHTSCDILDAGPISDWLTTVADWVGNNPYEVVTILLENGNMSQPNLYYDAIESSGILSHVYSPPKKNMTKDDWPTLEALIQNRTRVIMFLDYKANQTMYPWLMDEFSYIWETPMDPIDPTFPCTPQRPDGITMSEAGNGQRMYLMNHNLNANVNIHSASVSIPDIANINQTNAVSGYMSVGLAAENCVAQWGGPPLVLNVDYYNRGSSNGSVFLVAAQMNGVTYAGSCCGTVDATSDVFKGSSLAWSPAMIALTVGGALAVFLAVLILFCCTMAPGEGYFKTPKGFTDETERQWWFQAVMKRP